VTNTVFAYSMLGGLLVLALLVSICDFRMRRIPNYLLAIAMAYAVGLFISLGYLEGFSLISRGLVMSLLGMALGWFFLILPYRLRQVGAGDVKLLMVFGFFLGPLGVILALLNGAIIGGIWALVLSWRHGGFKKLWDNMVFMWRSAWLSGFKEMSWDLRSAGAVTMPYGVALSAGAALVAIWQLWIRTVQ
jgi:prepilin peptidase CpaA